MGSTEIAVVWIVSIVIGCLIGASKGQHDSGFIWPALLGPLGVIVVLTLPNRVKEERERLALLAAEEQMKVQCEMLKELKALRAEKAPGVTPLPPAAPPVIQEDVFIPENLSGWRGRRR